MGKSACWSYVTWYNNCSGNWATWEPGEAVHLGDIGRFDKDKRFRHFETLGDYNVSFSVSGEQQVASRLYMTGKDFRIETKAAGKSGSGFSGLGNLDAGGRITAAKEHACVLQLQDVTESHILKVKDVLAQLAALLLSGRWELDWVVVVKRLRVGRGFAAISRGAGQSLELKVTGDMRLTEVLDVGDAELLLAHGRSTTGFMLYEFSSRETPVFLPPIRVKQRLWNRLLPWRSEGSWLIDPDGRHHDPSKLSANLMNFAPEARRYDPRRSAMTLAELSGISIEDLFEEVTSLPDEIDQGESGETPTDSVLRADSTAPSAFTEVRSFPLPVPVEPAALAAANPSDDAPPLLEATSPDGLARFILHDRGSGEYWLEVSLAVQAGSPVVIALRYGIVGGGDRQLLIPVDDDGSEQPSSIVDLEDYAPGAAWQAWPPTPPGSVRAWRDDVVVTSIRAAATVATVEAWEHLVSAVPQATGLLITREIRALRDLP